MAFYLRRFGAALALASIAFAAPASAETVLKIKMTGDLQQIDPIWSTSYPRPAGPAAQRPAYTPAGGASTSSTVASSSTT